MTRKVAREQEHSIDASIFGALEGAAVGGAAGVVGAALTTSADRS